MNTFNKLILTTSLTLAASTASAAHLLALSEDGVLHTIDTESLRVTASTPVEGGSVLRGMDVRPADGQLYALGGGMQLYTLDVATGRATAGAQLSSALPGSRHAVVDFNPKADRLRLLAADGTNYRVNVETGEVVTDGEVAYQADSPYGVLSPKVVAGAYTNAYAGAPSTELYTVDLATDMLMLQNPPNEGVQQPVGDMTKGLDAAAMDIASDGNGGNTAYLLANGVLHTVDLATGTPTTLGMVAGLPERIIDIAVWPEM